MGIYADPYLLCNIGVYSTTGNVHVAAFNLDYPISDSLVSFMRTEPNVASIEVQNNTLYARVDTYFESVDNTVPFPMETNVDYYGYMVHENHVVGAFSGKIPHSPPPTVSDALYDLSVHGVSISGNISESPIGYTYHVLLADHDIGAGNVESFLSTHNVPETGNSETSSSVQPFEAQLNQPYDTQGNVLPFVQTTRNYHAYVITVNQHMLRATYPLEILASNPVPSGNVVFADTFPKYVDGQGIYNQGNLTMGNLDGEIVFSTNVASAFPGNTTYYVSVYEEPDDTAAFPDDTAVLRHLYKFPMRTGNLSGSDLGHLQIGRYYANTDSDETSALVSGQSYRMALLLLETETNHYSGEIRQERLPTFYPNIYDFAAAPIPKKDP